MLAAASFLLPLGMLTPQRLNIAAWSSLPLRTHPNDSGKQRAIGAQPARDWAAAPTLRAAAPTRRPVPVHMSEPADDDTRSFAEQVRSNVNEGQLSTRGEGWFVGQMCLILAVVFAPAQPLVPAVEVAVGLLAIASAITLGAVAVGDLGPLNLTPWPKPVEKNELRTEGVYSLCRHPMYTSLITGCFGLSLLNQSFERLLLTTALFALLSFKAGREEAFLSSKHGERYRAYSAYVPQFFPSTGAIKDFFSRD